MATQNKDATVPNVNLCSIYLHPFLFAKSSPDSFWHLMHCKFWVNRETILFNNGKKSGYMCGVRQGYFQCTVVGTTERTCYAHGRLTGYHIRPLGTAIPKMSLLIISRSFKMMPLPENHNSIAMLLHLISWPLTPNLHRIKPFYEYPLVIWTDKRVSLAQNYFKGIKVCPLWDDKSLCLSWD